MPAISQRVAARGFNVVSVNDHTGSGALWSQGGPQDPRHGQPAVGYRPPQTKPAYEPEPAAPPAELILEGSFGLAGSVDHNATPRTHAAPVPGWAGSYDDPELLTVHDNSVSIHSADFGDTVGRLRRAWRPEPEVDHWQNENRGDSVLQHAPGALRAGSRDVDQGYSRMNGYGFDAGHRNRTTMTGQDLRTIAYLDPAERPYVVPQPSGSFHPTDAAAGPEPYGQFRNGVSINATPPTPYTPPPDPSTAVAAPQGAPASAGWW